MEAASVGNENLWIEKYPEISFRISYEPFTPIALASLYDEDVATEIAQWRAQLQIEEIDILYLFGIGSGLYYPAVKEWLKEKRERMLIVLEDSLAVLAAFSKSPLAQEIIDDPQVHIQFIEKGKTLATTLKTLVETFSSHRVEVAALASYQRQKGAFFKKMRLKIWRESAVVDALMTEALYSHQLVENVLCNLQEWHRSFFANSLRNRFRNVPAVICGAGPSLSASIPFLQSLENKAILIAGGSAIAALSNQGIMPHIGMALDPNPEEYGRLKAASAFEIPFLYATRVYPEVFQTLNGPLGYIHSFTGGPCEAYFEQEFSLLSDPIGPDLGPEAFSVTTMAIALAVAMGCNPIILNGIDLAYTGMKRYAEGVMPSSSVSPQEMDRDKRSSERLMRRRNIQGEMVYTSVKWLMESSSIAAYARAHQETTFFNVTASGLGFKGIENCSFQEVIDRHCQTSYDLRAWLHTEMEQKRCAHITAREVEDKKKEISSSLKHLWILAGQILDELQSLKTEGNPMRTLPTGKMTILQLDFEEEKAFSCFLPHVGPAIDRLLNRSLPLTSTLDLAIHRQRSIERQITKWEQIKKMIEKELAYF